MGVRGGVVFFGFGLDGPTLVRVDELRVGVLVLVVFAEVLELPEQAAATVVGDVKVVVCVDEGRVRVGVRVIADDALGRSHGSSSDRRSRGWAAFRRWLELDDAQHQEDDDDDDDDPHDTDATTAVVHVDLLAECGLVRCIVRRPTTRRNARTTVTLRRAGQRR
jgi:hypothetical protein